MKSRSRIGYFDAARPRVEVIPMIDIMMFLLVFFVVALSSVANDSPTYDEPYHLGSAVNVMATGEYRLAPDHPPLARLLAAVFAWSAIPDGRRAMRDHPDFPRLDSYEFGRFVLYPGWQPILMRARAAMPIWARSDGSRFSALFNSTVSRAMSPGG